MSRVQTGVVVGKDFRPPDGAPPKDWCYLLIDVADDDRVAIRLHSSKVETASLGDRVMFRKPMRPNKPVHKLDRIGFERQ
jgi:hypothetical protein